MLEGCKLDPTLIIALDLTLQLGLPVDRGVGTRLVIIPDKEDFCNTLLRKVSNKFQGGQIRIKWLEDNFSELNEHAIALEKEQLARTFILSLRHGGGYHFYIFKWTPLYIPTGDKVELWAELFGTTRATRRNLTIIRSTLGS
ncbi:hypothetical protein Goari_011299 [Gossypium aridum]|uniref:Uncharacterized protein n=1 Tax=Gossypium aridum TaxID=34290 RepID=A0A7J8WWY1_GOSAI|nr:hypothetical protein [Gossypium aridum]